MRKGLEALLTIIMRGILGGILIFFINMAISATGLTVMVGINAVTLLTSGILGFPGVLALYGIGFYQML